MIEVKYAGRMGNNLFQYSLGRILAEELGFELKASPIPGFPKTNEPIQGHATEEPVETLNMHQIEFEKILENRSKRKIVLDGFFQRYEYYKPFKNKIREWLKPEVPVVKRHPKDIVLHVRKGDYLECRSVAPFSFYEEALSRGQWNRIFVCTDEPNDPLIRLFIKKYGATVQHSLNYPLRDFNFIMSFNNIVQSASSFSWWASFLSDAERIYTPVPLTGYWSAETPDLNLQVDDESRYIYIPCKEKYRKTPGETVYLLHKRATQKIENLQHRVRDRICTFKHHMRYRAQNLKTKVKLKLVRIDNFASPQIAGEKFRKMADWHFKPKKNIPSGAKLLFCETHNVPLLFDKIRHEKKRFVLISHDSDHEVDQALLSQMPSNITYWFSQNANVDHPLVEGLPIGMANTGWDHARFSRLRHVINQKIEKTHLAYLCVNVGSYREHRERVYDICRSKDFITIRGGQQPVPLDEHVYDAASHRFVLSPRGNGVDCHRTWEALHLGSFPIVERSLAMRYFEALPILFIDDFKELTRPFLEESLQTLEIKKQNLEMITFDYWKKRIQKKL